MATVQLEPGEELLGKGGSSHRWIGAGERNRTSDLLITNQLLYRLSYTGLALHYIHSSKFGQCP